MNRRASGRAGEEAARRYLEKNGWRILGQNVVRPGGEVDIICEREAVLAFVEVKMRTGAKYGAGAEAVTQTKMRRIAIVAVQVAQENGWMDRRIRFDVIEVNHDGIRHIEHAFDMPEGLF